MNTSEWRSRLQQRMTARSAGSDLEARVAQLEQDLAELREQSLRLAEIADVVQELLIPMAARDEEKIEAAIERFRQEL
ncbi:MAG: DUF6752 domain-containing protein [Marmoricola sp.]